MSAQRLPVVALALPPARLAAMFTAADLDALRREAHVSGPMGLQDTTAFHTLLHEASVAITGWGSPQFDAALLQQAPQLRLLAHSAGSVRGIVSDAVFRRGIQVTTAAAANATPVAQYTVAMMVTLLKQLPWLMAAEARNDQAALVRRLPYVRELQDVTVGLVGASRVGRQVVGLLRSYPGVRVRLCDPFLSSADAGMLGVERCSLDDVCRCEVVSLHAPRLPETRHLMNARTLALLPDHAVFINTARGTLVDEEALVAEVRRRPLYVLLDVTDPLSPPVGSPGRHAATVPPTDSPLRTEPNILLTPHIAGAMQQARRAMGRLVVAEVLRFLRGEPLQHEVTLEMLATQA